MNKIVSMTFNVNLSETQSSKIKVLLKNDSSFRAGVRVSAVGDIGLTKSRYD